MPRIFFALLLLILSSILTKQTLAQDQPNIIFILTDDLGWGDLGVFYQNDSTHVRKHRTPNLDAMAMGGLQMRAHYCPAPVCAPSRSSLLTGVHQGNAVVRNNQFDSPLENNHTLGSVLKQAGYRTCMIGKYGLQGGPDDKRQMGTPQDWPAYPTKRGFDDFFGYVSHKAGHLHYPNDPWELADKGHQMLPNVWWSNEDGDREVSESLDGCYTTDLFTARAKAFLMAHTQQKGDQPFFLMLNYDTPHAALQIPAMPYPEGGGVDGGIRWTGGENGSSIQQPAINTATGEVDSFYHPDYAQQDWTDLTKRFATMVRRIDTAVGDLRETLEELGIAENTLVVFTSDNGPHHEAYVAGEKWGSGSYTPQAFQSYGPFDGTKRDCWEGGIRMPTLAWWPGKIEAGRIDATPSQFHDWMATFCDAAKIPAPARCDGVSLLPTLTQQGQQAPGVVYIEYQNSGRTPKYEDFLEEHRGQRRREMQVIRMLGEDGVNYKGVRYDIQSQDEDFAIYNVVSDPDEAQNLAETSESFKAMQSAMKARVLRLRHASRDAKRPYDEALIPALTQSVPTEVRVARLPEKVDYVAAMPADAAIINTEIKVSANAGSLVATQAGLYQLTVGVEAPSDGTYILEASTPAACFIRLHESHAIDALERDGGKLQSTPRWLAAGTHRLAITMRAEKAGDTIHWSLRKK